MLHKSVLLHEAVDSLNLRPGAVAVDGTLGAGGHAREILSKVGDGGLLIGLDRDPSVIEKRREDLGPGKNFVLCHENFRRIESVLDERGIDKVDAVLLDIGFSSDQLEAAERGFSFMRPGPLDMRMDPTQGETAADLVNELPQAELESLFRRYGEERFSGRYAAKICEKRRAGRIETTEELARIIEEMTPARFRYQKRGKKGARALHPATRIFQALRIAVNDELGALEEGLKGAWNRLKTGGRLSVISFHSLEDRIVKHQFRSWHQDKAGRIIFKKPLVPGDEELELNPRSRSAKLRTIEKL